MLYIDGKQVNFRNTKEDYEFSDVVKDYHQTITALRKKHGPFVRFVTRRGIRIDKLTGQQRPPKAYSYPCRLKMSTDSGPQNWVYTASVPTIKDGVVDTSDPYFIISSTSVQYSLEDEPDFVYFLLHHRAVKSGRLRLDDPEADQQKRAEEMRQESKFRDIIYSENSPLAEDIAKLAEIARKWGVPGTETLSEYAIRNSLYDKVTNSEAAKKKGRTDQGIEEFLDDFDNGDSVKVGSDIQAALDKDILLFDRTALEWKLVVTKDQSPLSLMMVDSADAGLARRKLFDYLLKNKRDAELLDKTLHGKLHLKYGKVTEDGEEFVQRDVTIENIDALTHTELQKASKELGVSKFGATKEDMREAIKEKLAEQK